VRTQDDKRHYRIAAIDVISFGEARHGAIILGVNDSTTPPVPATDPDDQYRTAAGIVVGRIRRNHGWSLRDFASRVGVTHTSLYAIERAETAASIDTLARVGVVEGLDLPGMLSLVIDEMLRIDGGDTTTTTLSDLLPEVMSLDASQRAELLRFIEFQRFRDRQDQP
jgi:transcriptional regulator with XRE-family HTH domain